MTASAFLKLYALTAPLLFAIDLAWLGLVAKDALLVFAVLPGLERASLSRAAALGAGLGFICYCTYDLTNLALAQGFPAVVAVVDIAWGTVLGAGVSAAAFKLAGLVV